MKKVPGVESRDLHVVCERDVGLFSLVQQVIANIPWAVAEGRIPVVYFWDRCAYWTPQGFQGRHSVWEYYFEPLVAGYGEDAVDQELRDFIHHRFPDPFDVGYSLPENIWMSNHFGDHPKLEGKALSIPYEWNDPDEHLRSVTEDLVRRYVRPRGHILEKVDAFFDANMAGNHTIGAHIRGTDAISSQETRAYRKGSLSFDRYVSAIRDELERFPGSRVFVATDSEDSLDRMRSEFGDQILAYDSIRHTAGDAAGAGPTGWTMPAYIAGDRAIAAQNGAEAVIEFLILGRCDHLIHKGAGLARTVLLTRADLPHTNVHGGGRVRGTLWSLWQRGLVAVVKNGVRRVKKLVDRD